MLLRPAFAESPDRELTAIPQIFYLNLKVETTLRREGKDGKESSLDWDLSHWAHFTVRRFVLCVFVFFCFMLHFLLYHCEHGGWT